MLMHELLPIASAMRLPIVMGIANRAVSGPLNILNDHSDIMPQRDSGWISLFVENGQEAIDLSIQAFKIAEHKDVITAGMHKYRRFPVNAHGGTGGISRRRN